MSDTSAYTDAIQACLARNDFDSIEDLARQAFAEASADEGGLAWIAGVIFEKDIATAFDLVDQFVKRFPESRHIIRVYMADLWARVGRFDLATDHARIYLRIARDAGILEDVAGTKILAEGVGRAFLLLTCVYTECGARSYSRRLLQFALRHKLDAKWIERYRREIEHLDGELENPKNQPIDDMWEAFFTNGSHAKELYDLAMNRGFEYLAQRIDLIEGNHRFNQGYLVDESEMLQLVYASEQKELCLA